MTNLEHLQAKERVLSFFDNEISMYILPDIDMLTNKIRPDEKGLRGCTVPLAMMLFAVIDLFGYLMRDDEKAKKYETLENFKYLFSKRICFFPAIYEDNSEMIVKLFRHGLIHQFFPKASGITKSSLNNKPLIFEHSGIPYLNVNVLSNDVTIALNKIKQYIIEDRDNKLAKRINDRLDKLAKEDYDVLKEIFKGKFKYGIVIIKNFKEEKKLLVVRKHNTDKFIILGGKPEIGETGDITLEREVMEEIGCKVIKNSLKPFNFYEFKSDIKPYQITKMVVFLGKIKGKPTPLREIEEIRWIGMSDLDKSVSPIIKDKIVPDLISMGIIPQNNQST